MTKAEIVASISEKIGVEKVDVQAVVEAFMKEVKDSLSKDQNVYLRGFGSFIVKERASKLIAKALLMILRKKTHY